jgi:hypothetical protein
MLVIAGCKGNALVVVKVTANPPLSDVTAFVGSATAGGKTVPFTVHPKAGTSVTLPPEQSFGIQIPPSIAGAISVHLEAVGGSNETLAVGDGGGSISSGGRSDVTITLGVPPPDMSDSTVDMAADMAVPVVTISPSSFDFGIIAKNVSGQTKAFTIANTSTADLSPLAPATLASNSTSYVIVSDGCMGVALKSGDTCMVAVQFTPKAAGVMKDAISVGGASSKLLGTAKGAWAVETPVLDLSGTNGKFNGVWGSSANDVYVVGAVDVNGHIEHRDATGMWRPISVPANCPVLFSAWGTSATNVYAVGGTGGSGGSVIHSDGTASFTSYYYLAQVFIYGIWGSSPDELYTVWWGGSMPGMHYGVYRSIDGMTWSAQMGSAGSGIPPDNMKAIWGTGATDIYAVGVSGVYHSTGNGAWVQQDATANMFGVWGSGPSDIYAVGKAGVILHSTGNGTWQAQTAPMFDYNAVWGSGPDDVWVVGDGVVARSAGAGTWDGTFATAPVTSNVLTSIWGSSSGDIYAVGGLSIIHYR